MFPGCTPYLLFRVVLSVGVVRSAFFVIAELCKESLEEEGDLTEEEKEDELSLIR